MCEQKKGTWTTHTFTGVYLQVCTRHTASDGSRQIEGCFVQSAGCTKSHAQLRGIDQICVYYIYIYIYIFMYMYTYIYTCINVCMYMHVNIYRHIYIYIFTSLRCIYIYVYTYMYIHISCAVLMCVCLGRLATPSPTGRSPLSGGG